MKIFRKKVMDGYKINFVICDFLFSLFLWEIKVVNINFWFFRRTVIIRDILYYKMFIKILNILIIKSKKWIKKKKKNNRIYFFI